MNRLTATHRHHYIDAGPSRAWPDTHIRLECRCGKVGLRLRTKADDTAPKLSLVPPVAMTAVKSCQTADRPSGGSGRHRRDGGPGGKR